MFPRTEIRFEGWGMPGSAYLAKVAQWPLELQNCKLDLFATALCGGSSEVLGLTHPPIASLAGINHTRLHVSP